jgi:nitrate/TMAO reductase-like tetraheme cytochrome c subunit
MSDSKPSRLKRLLHALGHLSPAMLAVVGVVVAGGIGGGGYYAYRAYDYVQHDNDFCMQCHLMSEPFERFSQSAHQGLGCKACHRPTIFQRSAMGITAIVENPDEVSKHSAVPNEVCAECHIQGDPERWRSIAQSAGHRVHLESDDPVLQGLQCVECHATSIHEFAPIDRTCAQSQCHADRTIQLGGMSNLTIHCAACHQFVSPVAQQASLLGNQVDAAILPDYDECFSCHVMRTLVEMPSPDPHQGSCGACHNPHTQSTPAQAVGSCATVACHENVRSITPFHVGIPAPTISNCLNCHQAHNFELNGSNCAGCHEGMTAVESPNAILGFRHDDHPLVECAACHASTAGHGVVSLTSVQDCRSCHHTQPISSNCARCHDAGDAPDQTFRLMRSVSFSVGTSDARRVMTFPHARHANLDCASCHTQGIEMAVPDDLDCTSCHAEHHTAESDCASCHRVAPVSAHPPTQAHITCSGSGCHADVPFEAVPRTRAFCLGCHQDLRQHEPDRLCAECHTLPAPLPQRGGAP